MHNKWVELITFLILSSKMTSKFVSHQPIVCESKIKFELI
jgi:hypothetical protein